MSIKAILFDKDGTLIDFDATFAPATGRVLSDLANGDTTLAERMADAVGFDPQNGLIKPGSVLIAGSIENISAALFALCGMTDQAALTTRIDALYINYSMETLVPFEDLVPTLDELADMGLPLGVATNDSHGAALAHLGKLNLIDRFDYIVGYDSGFGEKPGPGMVTAFAEQLDIPPSALIMVGDSPHDCMAARAAGAVAVAITNGGANSEILAPHADHLLPRLGALPALVLALTEGHGAT